MNVRFAALAGLCLMTGLAWSLARADEGAAVQPTETIKLFNGTSLEGWQPFLNDKNADPAKTWSIQDGAIECTGKPAGYLRSAGRYKNYKLHVEWRWPDKPGNSGVLLHMSPPDKIWPKSIECQLMADHAGDFWVIDGADFKEHQGIQERRVPKKNPSNEKEPGGWNAYDIVCRDNTISVKVNGLLQNEATECNVSEGHILLQSEGATIQFRNVTVSPLD